MRLHRLKIKNIASLKGEHIVDFADIQKVSSLFAITGETGAGKSSILNCIGLALYGQIFKKSLIQNDVVTLGEKEGQIELIFEVKGKNYLAFWKARVRKLNGEFYSTPQSPTRELYTLEGDDFSSPKTITTQRIDELMNLDFDQFCKCVILNQGEFAKFLTSSFTERKDILEKLYPGELLESMSRELKIQMDELSKIRNDLDIKLQENAGEEHQGEDLKTSFERTTKNLGLEEDRSSQIELLSNHFSSLHTYHSKYHETGRKIAAISEELQQLTSARNTQLKEAESSKETYLEAQKAETVLSPRLLELLQMEENAQHLKSSLETLSKKNTTLNEELEKLKAKEGLTSERLNSQKLQIKELSKDLTLPVEDLLRSASTLERLFDELASHQLKDSTLSNQREKLTEAEVQGKELARAQADINAKLESFPADLEAKMADLEKRKLEIKSFSDAFERQKIQKEELQKSLVTLHQDLSDLKAKTSQTEAKVKSTEQTLLPLQSTLSMSELLAAKEVCLTAAHDLCPVCETNIQPERWNVLKAAIGRTDLSAIKTQADKLHKELMSFQAEQHQQLRLIKDIELKQDSRLKELGLLEQNPLLPPAEPGILDKELVSLQKQLWDRTKLKEEASKLEMDLKKAREAFAKSKSAFQQTEEETKILSTKIKASLEELHPFVEPTTTSADVAPLRQQLQLARRQREAQSQLEKLEQEIEFHKQKSLTLQEDLSSGQADSQVMEERLISLQSTLKTELAGVKASETIRSLKEKTQLAQEKWQLSEQSLKKHDFGLKDLQGRLTQLEELKKDFDLHFSQELQLCSEKATLPELLVFKSLKLTLESENELFIPLKEKLAGLREASKHQVGELKGLLGSLRARLEDFEKRQDKIKLFLLQRSEIQSNLDRLFDVLGKDELRTFVLSLVEENLIIETNQELQRLCQGRYEIVHQAKRLKNPDFYILDKYREGGLRKVSTLSGGETFMVSLAMALALAEMTRGQAEIDSLFIDEGFGTLDQDSLEDVLEMLGQIQTRGLMVGIISHIKPLTNSLPVNLVLNKKQDGTSTMNLQYN
jgi:exonuclease SbcC